MHTLVSELQAGQTRHPGELAEALRRHLAADLPAGRTLTVTLDVEGERRSR